MLSSDRLRAIVTKEVAGLPWLLRLGCVTCERGRHCQQDDEHVWYVQAQLWRADTDSREEGWSQGSKILLEPTMTEGAVVKRCFVAMRDYAEHEVREGFTWRGRRVLGPHLDIKALWDVAQTTEMIE